MSMTDNGGTAIHFNTVIQQAESTLDSDELDRNAMRVVDSIECPIKGSFTRLHPIKARATNINKLVKYFCVFFCKKKGGGVANLLYFQ